MVVVGVSRCCKDLKNTNASPERHFQQSAVSVTILLPKQFCRQKNPTIYYHFLIFNAQN